MKALSIRAPWWWFILHGGKDIENRDWATSFRGTVLIHSSKYWSLKAVSEDAMDAIEIRHQHDIELPHESQITFREMRDQGGCIVGQVDIIDCVKHSKSPWFFGTYGLVLVDPVAFSCPIKCKGSLGLFTVPYDVQELAQEEYFHAKEMEKIEVS